MSDLDLALIAPFDTKTPDLLTRSLSHVARANVVTSAGEVIPLDVEGGTLSFDEEQAPRCQLSLDCRMPTDQALLNRIDPRAATRVTLDVGYVRPDGSEDVHTIANLVLRSRTISRPEDGMRVEAMGDESLVIDDAPGSGGTVTGATTLAALMSVVRLIFPAVPFTTTGVTAGPAVSQTPTGDKWNVTTDLADRIDALVYDDGMRNWYCVPRPVLATPALDLASGAAGTVITTETSIDRDAGFANRVFLTYQWLNASNVTQKVIGTRSITSGIYAATTGNVKLLALVRELPATTTEAQAAAAALVKRTVNRGRVFSLTAVSAYWLRPGHTVVVKLPIGDDENHLVRSVRFDLRAGTMAVATRLPDNVGTIG